MDQSKQQLKETSSKRIDDLQRFYNKYYSV